MDKDFAFSKMCNQSVNNTNLIELNKIIEERKKIFAENLKSFAENFTQV